MRGIWLTCKKITQWQENIDRYVTLREFTLKELEWPTAQTGRVRRPLHPLSLMTPLHPRAATAPFDSSTSKAACPSFLLSAPILPETTNTTASATLAPFVRIR